MVLERAAVRLPRVRPTRAFRYSSHTHTTGIVQTQILGVCLETQWVKWGWSLHSRLEDKSVSEASLK